MSSLRAASLATVQARIARLILQGRYDEISSLGHIDLQPHQRSAVSRLRQSIAEFGGAILCDPVGTGKTFVALALSPFDASVIVVAPAVLKEMWGRALSMADRRAEFVSFESLSRGALPQRTFDFVIVDEAHHARNPKTTRYRMLSQLVARTDVLLLTATPIHNRRSDLVSLLSLFLGERAASLTPAEVSRCVLRRDDLPIEGMPAIDPVTLVRLRDDPRIPELLLSLPPPLPPRDGSDGGALIAHSLIRQWASSDAALIGGLKRRLVRAESLASALADGTWPSRSELISWIAGDDAVQLGFAGILASATANTAEMLNVVRQHVDGLRQILKCAKESTCDDERASLIRKIRGIHKDKNIIAFSQYADTVNALFAELSRDGKVAVLSGSSARVAGGSISRSEAIARFAPVASGRRQAKNSDIATLLLATDLLSEGVNLQDAGVVIHLDLPWTPARMEQRLGRIARVGSLHERVQAYAILPPISADAVVRIEGILAGKLEAAGNIVGTFPSLIGWATKSPDTTDPGVNEAARAILSDWMSPASELDSSAVIAAAASSPAHGFLAVAVDRGAIRMIAQLDDGIGDDPRLILDCLRKCSGVEAELSAKQIADSEAIALAWIQADNALNSTRSSTTRTTVRSGAARRITRAVRRARAHQRACLAEKAERALTLIANNLGAHDEAQVAQLCREIDDDAEVLDRILTLDRQNRNRVQSSLRILSIIVLAGE